MGEEYTGESDLGTAVEEEVESEIIESEGTGDENQTEESEAVETEVESADMKGIKNELWHAKEEARKLREYNAFLKEAGNQPKAQVDEEDELADDDVPYVGDTKKLIKKEMDIARATAQEDQIVSQMETIGKEKQEADSNFPKNMDLAFELIEREASSGKTALKDLVMSKGTAEGRIKVLEYIASEHPMHVKSDAVNKSKALMDKVKANASIPTQLSSVGGSGKTSKAWTDMSDEDYEKEFQKITKQM